MPDHLEWVMRNIHHLRAYIDREPDLEYVRMVLGKIIRRVG